MRMEGKSRLANIPFAKALTAAALFMTYRGESSGNDDSGSLECGKRVEMFDFAHFDRQAPLMLNPEGLGAHGGALARLDRNQLLDSYKPPTDSMGIRVVANATVAGSEGMVMGSRFADCTEPGHLPRVKDAVSKRLPKMNGTIQRVDDAPLVDTIQAYGWMFYHTLGETIPRLAALFRAGILHTDLSKSEVFIGGRACKGTLKDELARAGFTCPHVVDILTWGTPHESTLLSKMGVPSHRIVSYEETRHLWAKAILYPSPVDIISPQQEYLASFRSIPGIVQKHEPIADKIVYCSRKWHPTRHAPFFPWSKKGLLHF